MNAIEWLKARAPGFAELSGAELDAIMHFVLLWSFFEAKVLATRGSAQAIITVARQWEAEGRLSLDAFQESLAHFHDRYYHNGIFNEHFIDLNFQKRDNRLLVQSVLSGDKTSTGDIFSALLIIVYRLRNNLFHGVKWRYGIRGQLNNFEIATTLLIRALELHGHL